MTYALARNITAVTLVLALVAQSTRLLLGVVHESFDNQVKWDELGFQINTSTPFIYGVGFSFLQIAIFYAKFINFARKLIHPFKKCLYTCTFKIQMVRLNKRNVA